MKTVRLSTQLLILFTTVTLISAVVFGLITYKNYGSIYVSVAKNELKTYIDDLVKNKTTSDEAIESEYTGFVVVWFDEKGKIVTPLEYVSSNLKTYEGINSDDELTKLSPLIEAAYEKESNYTSETKTKYELYLHKLEKEAGKTKYVIGVLHAKRVHEIKNSVIQSNILLSFGGTFIAFAIVMIVGNIVLALWSAEMAKRIRSLSAQVSTLSDFGYTKKIEKSGADEIGELEENIEYMRVEIAKNEQTKQEMFQNLSHDFKTPITVIKSYAEAIEDGIADVKDAKIIIEQSVKLQQKVDFLLQYNKLEYIDSTRPFEKVLMKEVIEEVLKQHKIRLVKFNVKTDLDDSVFDGFVEHYITVVSNILDNAIRYAISTITINLKNNRLTFHNDGRPIDQKYIDDLFKPYEKGTDGQFGLGMSIVQKTVNRFGYRLSVINIDDGVMFIIEP